jgi:hypothetical protein
MRRILAAFLVAASALAGAAQQTQQCVNPQLIDGLVYLGRGEMKMNVTRGQASFMRGLSMPATLTLIGNGVREGGLSTVAYKSALSTDKAYAAIIAALGADGWTPESTPGSSSTFIVAGSPREGTLCRNGERRHVLVTDTSGVRYINVMASVEERRRECNLDPYGPGATGFRRDTAPRFQFPEGTILAQGGSGGGGSNSMYTTSTRIISEETPARLVEHLASQIEGQGWQRDAEWSGSDSSGFTWRKIQDGELAWGALEIIRVSAGTYDVDFITTQR